MHFFTTSRAVALAALAVVSACASDSSTAPLPTPGGSLIVTASVNDVYEGDTLSVRAVVRDASGRETPATSVTWSTPDTAIVEVGASGSLTTLRAGVARLSASSGGRTATLTLSVRRLTVLQVSVLGLPDTLASGDVVPFGVRVQGEGGRDVHGRLVTLASTNPDAALIDPSGRVRGVAAGTTTIRATVDGVSGSSNVAVGNQPAVLPLRQLDGERLPLLIAKDSVVWNGAREYHEVYLESGSLQLSGGAQPRYLTDLRYAEYAVRTDAGQRRMELRLSWTERDRGTVRYDGRGDLAMTSEMTAPLSHAASPESAGITMRYRIPGDDIVLGLFFRREPK